MAEVKDYATGEVLEGVFRMQLQLNDATKLIRKPSSRVVIRFQDCDPFGHLNNGDTSTTS